MKTTERNGSLSQAIGLKAARDRYNQPAQPDIFTLVPATYSGIRSYLVPNIAWKMDYHEADKSWAKLGVNFLAGPALDVLNLVGSAVIAAGITTDIIGTKYPEGMEIVYSAFFAAKIGTNALNNYFMGRINRRLSLAYASKSQDS